MATPSSSEPRRSPYLSAAKGPQKVVPVPEYERLLAVLDSVPGPSPWFVGTYLPMEGPNGSKLKWKDLGTMYCGLVPESDSPLLLALGGYNYPKKLSDNRLLIWHAPMRRDVQLTVIDTNLLRPLEGKDDRPLRVDDNAIVTAVNLPYNWSVGAHDIVFPEPLKELYEILLMVNNPAAGYWDDFVYSVQPSRGHVDVYEPGWYNKGGFDRSYVWITRLARDDETRKIVGEGVRIPPFLMNEKCELEGYLNYP